MNLKNENESTSLTKTRAKKSVILTIKNENKYILKDVKKKLPDAKYELMDDQESTDKRYLVEFPTYAEAKKAKESISEAYDQDLVKCDLGLHEIKRLNPKTGPRKTEEPNEVEVKRKPRGTFEITVPKIILRNISFRITEEVLKKEMEKYGKVSAINLPRKEDDKLKGYAFITFENKKEANKAIEGVNSSDKKLMGTKMVADWCLPKNVFLRNQSEVAQDNENGEKDEDSNENDDEGGSQSGDQDKYESDQDMNSEDEDIEGNEDEEELPKKRKKNDKDKEEKPTKNPKLEKKAKEGTQDVQEKRTVFLRNLSYDTTEEMIEEAFSKFGPIKYVKICQDRELERPRGTAFVQFENNQSAMDACAESNILDLDFRTIQIDMALSRIQVKDVVDEKASTVKEKKDSRNLDLAKEGVIYSNSYEAEGVPKADMIKRENLEKQKTQKLKLLHYFVSRTRLTVHNIPRNCSDDQLREVFLKAIGSSKRSLIVKCRIMRDLTRVSADGVPRSKGFGFVEFKEHAVALKALHATNNNPGLFPKSNTRLIVQFSVENLKAVKKVERRNAKSARISQNNSKKFNKK